MIVEILAIIQSIIFAILSGFHFYWFFGGIWGLDKVIPTKINEEYTLTIPKFATLIVALALFSFGLTYLIKAGLITFTLPDFVTDYAYWFIPIIFILRAIGEFNYVGFFKKIKDTKFAKADDAIFSPICLVIGIIGILIQLIA